MTRRVSVSLSVEMNCVICSAPTPCASMLSESWRTSRLACSSMSMLVAVSMIWRIWRKPTRCSGKQVAFRYHALQAPALVDSKHMPHAVP